MEDDAGLGNGGLGRLAGRTTKVIDVARRVGMDPLVPPMCSHDPACGCDRSLHAQNTCSCGASTVISSIYPLRYATCTTCLSETSDFFLKHQDLTFFLPQLASWTPWQP